MSHTLRAALLCFTFLSCSAIAKDANTFSNPTAGLEISKPTAWQFTTVAQTQENLKATKLNDQEFQATMLKYASAPMVAMMKYPEPFDDVNPSFKVNIKPLGPMKGKTPIEIISAILPQLQRVFKNYELMQPPMDVEVSGLKAAYARIHYSLETSDGLKFPTSSELWIVPRGDFFFMLGAGTRQDEKTGSRSEIQAILKSVKIDH